METHSILTALSRSLCLSNPVDSIGTQTSLLVGEYCRPEGVFIQRVECRVRPATVLMRFFLGCFMDCPWCCQCSLGLPPLCPGLRSGGAVVGCINCQSVWWVMEADGIETKRPCGTFPQSHTSTHYLHFNVPFCFSRKL